VVSPDAAMTFNAASNAWEFSVAVPNSATQLNCVFNNGSGTWDNNNGANWNFSISNAAPPATWLPFVMDGSFDATGYLLASNGMVLYGAVRGSALYVATWSPGAAGPNDHFIFVSDQLLSAATAAAPWAKSGKIAVASNKPYLAAESANSYVSWFINGAATNSPCAKSSTSSGALEGAIDLVSAFGYVPTNIYICAAAYQTADGGSLVAQCPAGSGPDIDPGEFLAIPALALRDNNSDGVLDRMDPALDFRMLSVQAVAGGWALNWAVMPGRSYQVLGADSLSGPWNNLPNATNATGALQLFGSYTDAVPSGVSQHFYRVQLLR
jgi:hypothetical protein